MSPAKITVGIPTFNRSRLLKQTIETVLAQTFTSFRLIVGDNASEDDTPDVVRSFGDERIDYVRSARNIGAIGNLNRLIELAETEFLVLLPDDDGLYPGHLAAAVELLERFETVGLAHTAWDHIDARSHVIRRVNPLMSRTPARIDTHDRALEWLMVSTEGPCFPSIAYRTKAIVGAGGFREEQEPFSDRQMWMRIALEWDFGYIAKPLARFRTHPETIGASIVSQNGSTLDERERSRRFSQINFQRRIDFLHEAPLEPQRTERLHAFATLQHLAESANLGLPWDEVAACLANLVRTYPRIVLHPTLWRLVVAQLGGRRVRSALRRAAPHWTSGKHKSIGKRESIRCPRA
jgi:glycosyltransferase involved in cell wall biosynthesis